jgi:hypothetical protein
MPELTVGFVSLEQFLKGLTPSHEVWARKYAVNVDDQKIAPAFFALAIPKGVKVGPGLIEKLAGDIVSSLVEAAGG